MKYRYDTGLLSDKNIEKVKHGKEIELYMIINSLGYFIWRMNHDATDGRITITPAMEKDLQNAQLSIEFAVFNTKRFDVQIKYPEENEHVERSESYSKWYDWWDEYVQRTLSNQEYQMIMDLINSGKDISGFRPEGTWNK